MTGSTPRCLPMACGAIGPYRLERVRTVAAGFEQELSTAHEAPDAIVMTDRPPRRWTAEGRQGLSWGRALPPRDVTARSWQDAAELGDCGLVVGPGGPLLHSSTPGVYPLYWHAEDGAAYFASRVDPLAQAASGPLVVDWDAWAAILTCGVPLAGHTPFQQIRRLLPQAWIKLRGGALEIGADEWPWLAIEPRLSIEQGAGPVVEALREIVSRLPDEPLPFGLSGGLDSRVLACLIAERGLDVTAYTVNGDSGNDSEQRAAAAVAAALGLLRHERVAGQPQDFWEEAEERGVRTDYQRLSNPWLNPVHSRLAVWGTVVLDGLGGDITADRSRYMLPEMLDPESPGIARPLWRGMWMERGSALAGDLGDALAESARDQVRSSTSHLAGHPNRAVFGPYWTRMIGGVARVSMGSLGTQALVEAPFVTSEVAAHSLSVAPHAKFEESMRRAMIELVNPAVAALPSNHDQDVGARPAPRRRTDPAVLQGFQDVLADGPLTPYVPPAAWAVVRGQSPPAGERPRRVWRCVDGVVTYHTWFRRYRSIVTGADPAEALQATPP